MLNRATITRSHHALKWIPNYRTYASMLHFTATKHVGYKSAIWYWHFVDFNFNILNTIQLNVTF